MKRIILYITVFSLFFGINGQNIKSGLIGYYPFNGNANDASGNGNNGLAVGTTTTTDRNGKSNAAFTFSGSSYIFTPIMSGFTNKISLCAWFKTEYSDYAGIICSRYSNYASTDISTDKYGQPNFHMSDGLSSNVTNTSISYSGINLNDNKWHFLVGTYDGTNRKIYVDGVLKTTLSNFTFNLFIQNPFVIGWDQLSGYNRYFNGAIDEVRIYDRDLTSLEVKILFQDGACSDYITNDTITYPVTSSNYKTESPTTIFFKTDSLKTMIGGCDSIVNRYSRFVYSENSCTGYNTLYKTDTLIIKRVADNTIEITDNFIKIYPNPTKNFINIDISSDNNSKYNKIVILNEIGITQSIQTIKNNRTIIDVSNWTKGIYIILLENEFGTITDKRKITVI